MTPVRSRFAIAGVAALALALVAAWWWHTYERVERTVHLPPRGEARYNPLYALRLALRDGGVAARSRQRLRIDAVPLRARDTVLILNDPRTLSTREGQRLLGWVAAGGHLIVRTPPPGALQADAQVPVLSDVGVRPSLAPPECTPWLVRGQPRHVEFCEGRRFTLRKGIDAALAWSDTASDNGFVFARLPWGAGSVDVVSDVDFLTNDKLNEGPHIVLARQLLQPNWGRGTIHLVYAASMPPLWRLLLDHAWMAWTPLLLALAAWLWMRMQRFGPRSPAPAGERRSLLEHVQASGEHLYRYGRAHALHAAMVDAFLARLRRRDPYAAALDGDAQAQAIAARTGLPAADVAFALRAPRPNDAKDFRQRIATLVQLRQRL